MPELEILGAPVASEEIVVLMVVRSQALLNDSDVPKDAKVEITKAPFHAVMKLGQGVKMTAENAAWHLAKAQGWNAAHPLALKVLSLEEAQALKGKEAAVQTGNDGAPDYPAMKVAELRAVLVEKGLADANEADALSKPDILKLLA